MSESEHMEVDYSKVGKKGYPHHFVAHGAEPPMKPAEKQKEANPQQEAVDGNQS